MSGNSVTIIGNVTRDPELRFTQTGQATASFGIAVNRRWQNRQTNDWEEAVSFFNVVCWRELAENAAESLHKGTRVIVTGRLEQRSWESNGEKKTVVDIVADEVGPSLRWASAQVTRSERRTAEGGGSGGNSGGGNSGGGNSGGNSGGGGFSRPAANNEPAGSGYEYDEEPF